MYNMDETGLALGVGRNQFVLGNAERPQTYIKTPNNREWVSIIETIAADGRLLQPLVIFKGQSLQSTWFLKDSIPD